MKKLLVVIILLLVATLAVLTRPAEQQHKETMMVAVREYVEEEARERGFGDNVITQTGITVVVQAVKTALNSKLHFSDYYLFNVSRARIDGEEQLMSLGLFGHVFIFDKEMLRERLKKASDTKEVDKMQKAATKE